MKKELSLAIVIVLLCVMALSACSGSDTKSTEQAKAPESTEETKKESTAVNEETMAEKTETEGKAEEASGERRTTKNNEDIVIGFVAPFSTHPSWQLMKKGVMQAAEDGGFTALWTGPTTNGDVQQTVEVMKNYVNQGVDGIVSFPLSESAFIEVHKAAAKAGIPVVTVGCDTVSDKTQRLAFFGTDNKRTGREQIIGLQKALGGTEDLKALCIVSYMDSSNQIEEVDAMKAYCEELSANGADAAVLDVKDCNGAMDDVLTYNTASGMLKAYPEANLLICMEGTGAATLGKAVKDAGLEDKVKVSGYDDQEQCLAALRDGSVYSLMVQNFYSWGYAPTIKLFEYLNGEDLEDYYDTGIIEVTKENVDDYMDTLIQQSETFQYKK